MKQELVKNWMTTDIMFVNYDTDLTTIHSLMTHEHIRHLPVVEHGQLMGIVSQGDLRSAIAMSLTNEGRHLGELKAEDIMTPTPLTIAATATIDIAAEMMLRHKISGLPVTDESEQVVGIITESDILQLVVKAWRETE